MDNDSLVEVRFNNEVGPGESWWLGKITSRGRISNLVTILFQDGSVYKHVLPDKDVKKYNGDKQWPTGVVEKVVRQDAWDEIENVVLRQAVAQLGTSKWL